MTQLVNITRCRPDDVVMIGRSSPYGNPFRLKKDGGEFTRSRSVERFEEWWYNQDDLRARAVKELTGRTMGCYCLGVTGKYGGDEPIDTVHGDPDVCHGEVILRFLNNQENL